MKKQIIILIVPIFFSCASNSNQKLVPDWYLKPSVIDDTNISTQHIGIGSGESKGEAVVSALGNAIRQIIVRLPNYNLNEIVINTYEFGLITYKNSYKVYSTVGSSKAYEISEISEITSLLTLDGSNSIILKNSERTFEIIPKNKKLTSFYSELVKNGINIVKEEKIGLNYFIAISINISELKNFNHS